MTIKFITDKDQSRINWGNNMSDDKFPGYEVINSGCLQRIAEATEAMAKTHVQLQNDYNYMRESRDRYRTLYEKEAKRSAAFKGLVKRYKANKK